jgi:translation initiation factor IF-3
MELVAHFKVAGQKRTFEKGSSQKFYVDIDKGDKYPSMGEFEVYGDKISLSQFNEGDKIKIFFNIKGRKAQWEKSGEKKSGFFQTLQVWKIEKIEGSSNEAPISEEDSLPF